MTLSDTLPTNAGLSWSIASQGAGWNSTCAIAAGKLTCGGANGVTVKAGTTQAASTFTVHITSPTTGATGGDCPETGVVDNTGSVTTTNAGSDDSSASTCVQAMVDLSVTKSGSPATQTLGDGQHHLDDGGHEQRAEMGLPGSRSPTRCRAEHVRLGDDYAGHCTNGAIVNCHARQHGRRRVGDDHPRHDPDTVGTQTNTVTVAGTGRRPTRPTTLRLPPSDGRLVTAAGVLRRRRKVSPKSLFVGRKTKLTMHLASTARQSRASRSGSRARRSRSRRAARTPRASSSRASR